ncbi:DUF2972 domain-containing protein, partial [Campylobacter upsaliensis]
WVKTWLTYRLGRVLLECDRDKLKGGYFKFFSKIKQAKKEFKALKESKVYRLKDKLKFKNEKDFDLFIKNYALIENLLTHYEALNEVIVSNVAFVLEHFDEVSLWLNSKEFKEKYEDINHPYPPLLNPDKLNDENYILNYEKIPANLAWEMNLPLPRRYGFVCLRGHGSGGVALSNFLKLCGINTIDYFCQGNGFERYCKFYRKLLELKDERNCIAINDVAASWYGNLELRDKLFASFDKITPVIFQVRDPIELIKHAYGRKWGNSLAKLKEFSLNHSFEDVIKAPQKYDYNLPNNFLGQTAQSLIWTTLSSCFKRFEDVTYLDISRLRGEETIKTMQFLAKKFDFKLPHKELHHHFTKSFYDGNLVFLLPLTLWVEKPNLQSKIAIHLTYTKTDLNDSSLINLYDKMPNLPKTSSFIGFYMKNLDYESLSKDTILYEKICNYLCEFINNLLKRIEIERDLMLKSEMVLEHLKNNDEARKSLKEILDKELVVLKQNCPDIVNSWKYYKEFEKICEELGSAERD